MAIAGRSQIAATSRPEKRESRTYILHYAGFECANVTLADSNHRSIRCQNAPTLRESAKGALMKTHLVTLWKEEEGQDLVEYALLIVLVGLAAVAAMGSLANSISTTFSRAGAKMAGS